jgi:hypothetical protein
MKAVANRFDPQMKLSADMLVNAIRHPSGRKAVMGVTLLLFTTLSAFYHSEENKKERRPKK